MTNKDKLLDAEALAFERLKVMSFEHTKAELEAESYVPTGKRGGVGANPAVCRSSGDAKLAVRER